MRLAAQILGGVQRVLEAEVKAGERAVTRAIKAETAEAQRQMRAQTAAGFGARGRSLVNAWRARTFPPSGDSLRAAGLVWTKAPLIMDAAEKGRPIRVKNSRYLAWPTGFNAVRGRRNAAGRGGVRVTPEQMMNPSFGAFVIPVKARPRLKLWCLPTRQAQRIGRTRGARRTLLFVGDATEVATGNRRGRAAFVAGLAQQGFVPMYFLATGVPARKRIDLARVQREASQRLPGRIVAEWESAGGIA